jgi:hypothetical protein
MSVGNPKHPIDRLTSDFVVTRMEWKRQLFDGDPNLLVANVKDKQTKIELQVGSHNEFLNTSVVL